MIAPPVSVIVVSRGRPGMLARCLTGISQLDYPNFEVVVVADPAGLVAVSGFPVKAVAFDEPNISAARNLGIEQAAGEVVAFIDDDAVPEPQWLAHLAAPFADPEVAAAGGHVAGTNGISLQWAGGFVDRLLGEWPLSLPDHEPRRIPAAPGWAVEVKGVNCAYRRAVIAGLGGFDPNLAYYLDETDLNLRLAVLGAVTAVVPCARVHHAKAASHLRRADRVPLTLRPVGVSTAVTLRRQGATPAELDEARANLQAAQRARLGAFVVRGRLRPAEIEALLADLAEGFADGTARSLSALPPLAAAPPPFRRFPSTNRAQVVLTGRAWQARRLHAQAARAVAAGAVVRLFLFSPTTLYHRVRFHPGGYWLQTGGLFGRSLRTDPLFRPWRFHSRCRRELQISIGFGRKPDSQVSPNSTNLTKETHFAADFPLDRRDFAINASRSCRTKGRDRKTEQV
jgi:O-antigen biosynthesis protein